MKNPRLCEHLVEEKNHSDYCGRPVTETIWRCDLECDWECEDCDGEGNYQGDDENE